MKYLKTTLVILLFLVIISACNKNTSTSPQTTGNANNNAVDGSIIYKHIISINTVLNYTNTIIQPFCWFYNTPVNSVSYNYVNVGNVSINNILLDTVSIQPGHPAYQSSSYSITAFPLTYSITGGNGFPAMSFVDNGSWMPYFNNYNQLPNTISKSSGFTYTLSGLINTSNVEVKINNDTYNYLGNVITISPAQLTTIPSSTFSTLQIKCSATETKQVLGGKNYNCLGVFYYQKSGINITN